MGGPLLEHEALEEQRRRAAKGGAVMVSKSAVYVSLGAETSGLLKGMGEALKSVER